MAIAVFSFKFSYVSSNEAFATCCDRNIMKKKPIDFMKLTKFILMQVGEERLKTERAKLVKDLCNSIYFNTCGYRGVWNQLYYGESDVKVIEISIY